MGNHYYRSQLCSTQVFMLALLFGASLLLTTSCTTATYGKPFLQDEHIADQYSFKIYVGGYAGPRTADERAHDEIKKFMVGKNYSSYKIISRRYNFIPSYYKYVVLFSKEQN